MYLHVKAVARLLKSVTHVLQVISFKWLIFNNNVLNVINSYVKTVQEQQTNVHLVKMDISSKGIYAKSALYLVKRVKTIL